MASSRVTWLAPSISQQLVAWSLVCLWQPDSLGDQERKDPELRSPRGLSLGSPGALEKAEPLSQKVPPGTSAPLLERILVTH